MFITVQFYRSLLSDIANYILTDAEIVDTLIDVNQYGLSIHQALECDERFAMAVI